MITAAENATLKITMAADVHSEIIHDIPAFPIPACPSWFRQEIIDNVKNISIIVILGIINAVVIVGNLLVVMAVFASAKLRTVTNFIIVSLAVSDLLVGLAVLPYSITLEVLEFWIFGELWCQMWLAVDVWLCTASILNLCAISIDRYLAITRPVHYRTIMSNFRVKLLIAVVWVLSFIICFPPLVGWNDRVKDEEDITPLNNITHLFGDLNNAQLWNEYSRFSDGILLGNNTLNFTDDSMSNISSSLMAELRLIFQNSTSRRCPKPQCALITNQGYVIYSALGSFYIPLLIMLFFYYRIYVVALKTSRALDRGFLTEKSKGGKASTNAQEGSNGSDVTLRIHRGKPANVSACAAGTAGPSKQRHGTPGDIVIPRRIPTAVVQKKKGYSSPSCFREDKTKLYYATKTSSKNNSSSSHTNRIRRTKSSTSATSNSSFDNEGSPCTSTDPKHSNSSDRTATGSAEQRNGKLTRQIFTRMSKRNARWHAKRFRTEAKATKTVGIIVGGFILCWLPFFTVYLIMGFCGSCIPNLLFKVFFYLGYCNSAINPLIYGMVSKDFRFAFKKILCRCKLKDDGVQSLIRQIHMPSFFEEEKEETMTVTVGETISQN